MKLLSNSELTLVIHNFISETFNLIMLDESRRDTLCGFINYVLKNGSNLYSPGSYRSDRIFYNNKKQFSKSTVEDYDKIIFLYEAFPKYFLNLEELWKKIKESATSYYRQLFENNYGHLFRGHKSALWYEIYFNSSDLNVFEEYNLHLFTYFLLHKGNFVEKRWIRNDRIIKNIDEVYINVKSIAEEHKRKHYSKKLMASIPSSKRAVTIDDVDLMNGSEFEEFVCRLFANMGYTCTQTGSSGDQGIDVIARKDVATIGVQAKCYSSTVSNRAVQEVISGMAYYDLSKGLVVTNNFFSKSAISLSQKSNVILWDRDLLKQKIDEYFL